MVTLTGVGVGLGNQDFHVGGVLVEVLSRDANEVVIRVPPMDGSATADVTLGSEIPIVISQYSYDQSNEITFSASKTTFSVKGEPGIQFTFRFLTGIER